MFVFSVRASALRFFSVIAVSVAALVMLIAFVPTYVPASLLVGEDTVSYDHITTEDHRRAFLSSFGWETSVEGSEAIEVTIPAKFDSVYEGYNDIQRAQGLNLERYRGKKVMRYTYAVTNYPDYEGTVYATLLVYKDKVIGADICSADVEGFVHGLSR